MNASSSKILILTERFFPEEFLINDLAGEWKSRGHEVEVLTQVPSYPRDRVYDGYRNGLFQTTCEWNGIPVHRVRTLTGYNRSVVRKILNYINFAFLTSLWALFRGWRYDRVFIYHTGPLTMASAGLVLHHVCRRKCMIWTQDIWPDTVYAYGFKPSWWKRFLLDHFVRLIYSGCDYISVSCSRFRDKLKKYTAKEILFLPQWTSQNFASTPPVPHEKTVFTFAGNIGSVQNLETVLEAFLDLNPPDAELRLVGGGIYLERLKQMATERNSANVVFTGRLPQEKMPEVFAGSDIMILSLKAELSLTIPAKFQAYIAAGKPIFGIVRGETEELIRQYDLGICVESDLNSVREGFRTLLNTDRTQRERWSDNARHVSATYFQREKIIAAFSEILSI